MVGYLGVYLGRPNGMMPHHLADGFYRNPIAQANQGRETVPGLMESDRLRKEKQTEED